MFHIRWDGSVRQFSLPLGFQLLLADIDAGSNTPSMVGKLMQWRREHPVDAELYWAALNDANGNVQDAFMQLWDLSSNQSDYSSVLNQLSDQFLLSVSLHFTALKF